MQTPSDFYRIQFTADPVQLVFFRAGLGAWLEGLQWPTADRIDALLAISEACTNSVQHAYRIGDAVDTEGEIDVTGRVVAGPDSRRIVVTVRDSGVWRGSGDSDGVAGYGLTAIRACMERVKIQHDERGTVVTMTSRAVPLAARRGETAPGATATERATSSDAPHEDPPASQVQQYR
ncbi:ATP-binding protein [Pseudonocardia sp. TRM90224]|uniref:ATP-binding protein n=1 Tax=Pseudonocardia sp. TRM90224 TaxID=2812678 RepID=UPI001E3D6C98|nr:ATP-binding protein [Pseudonocardia sp. TRM90224]